jgi:hypothetical protein
MLAKVYEAIEHAAAQAAEELRSDGSAEKSPAAEYFAAVVHQKMFLKLCGADPDTMRGGDPAIAFHLIDSGRKISEHYWGKKPEDVVAGAASE